MAASVLDQPLSPSRQVQVAFSEFPTGGIYSETDLVIGHRLLEDAGFVTMSGDVIEVSEHIGTLTHLEELDALEMLLAALFSRRPPAWLRIATASGEVANEMIPETSQRVLNSVIQIPERREAFLLAMGQRWANDEAHCIGDLGEQHVESELKAQLQASEYPDLSDRVRRVSLISDQLGYDLVAPRLDLSLRRIEVKTTATDQSTFKIHISRNEAEVATRDPDWMLVVCRLEGADKLRTLGWISGADLGPAFPKDVSVSGHWTSAIIWISEHQLAPGLPAA